MGSFYRNIKHLSAEYIGSTDTACDHGSSCAVSTGISSLGTAETEFHNAIALCSVDNTLCFSCDQTLVVDNGKKCCFNQLCLHDRCDYFN